MTMKDFKKLLEEAETRLYQYPKLTARIDEMKQDIAALESMNYSALMRTSGSIVRATGRKHKRRRDPTDKFDAQIGFLKSRVEMFEKEVRALRKALDAVCDDPYYLAIEYKYFMRTIEEYACKQMQCSISTLRRNRKRLLHIIVDVLYGMRTDKVKGEKNE